jgi:hypothetical protein
MIGLERQRGSDRTIPASVAFRALYMTRVR